MKKSFLLLIILAIFAACAPEAETPAADEANTEVGQKSVQDKILDDVNERYPDAKDVEIIEQGDWFFAAFELEGRLYSAKYDYVGFWKSLTKELNVNEIPENITATLRRDYPDNEITKVLFINSLSDGKFFRINIEEGESGKSVFIDEGGAMMKASDAPGSDMLEDVLIIKGAAK